MTTFLVTGGSGFIGSALCRHLVTVPGARVVNVDKLSYAGSLGATRSLDPLENYRFVRADICDEPRLLALLREEKVDVVVHLAAETHVDRSIADPSAFLEANVVGTHRLLCAARFYWEGLSEPGRGRFRFHHVSTDEVFGALPLESGLFSETTAYAPSSPYSASKAASDHFVRAFNRTYGLPVTVSNCSNNYGPFQYPEKLIPVVVLNALRGRPIPVYGDGRHVRDWLHVDDHVRAIETIVATGRVGESYNVGGGSESSNLELVETICRILDGLRPRPGGGRHAELITFVDDRRGHDRRYGIDSGKLRTELGWRPVRSLERGLEQTVGWYLDNEWWWRPLLGGDLTAGAA